MAIPSYLKLKVHPGDNPVLVLIVDPHPPTQESLNEQELLALIGENETEGWFIDKEQVGLLIREQQSLKVSKGYRVAERRDAMVQVEISADRVNAFLTITPPFGGRQVSKESLISALEEVGVKFGILESQIPDLLSRGECQKVMIAEGLAPQDGQDAILEQLVQELGHKGRPQERQDGTVDYRDLGLFISVSKGTPLLRRHVPTVGTPGTGVDGQPIAPKPGKNCPLHPGPGTEIAEGDPELLVASVPGQPLFTGRSVKVIPKLELGEVDFETGDIDFDGSVYVRGSVQPGFKIKAAGDIVIADTVDGAKVEAGGSIEVRGGVFGQHQALISSAGNIKARFLHDCTVVCQGNIEVEDLIANCSVTCEGVIEVGKRGGKGQIYGGRLLACKGIHARILGSPSEMVTQLIVSPSPQLIARHQEVKKEILQSQRVLEDGRKSLDFLKGQRNHLSDPRIDALTETCISLADRLEKLKAELEELSERILAKTQGKIAALQVYAGVSMQICNRRKVTSTFVRDLSFDTTEDSQGSRAPERSLPQEEVADQQCCQHPSLL